MATTTDPLNFVLESIRTQLIAQVTDPFSSTRPSGSPFVIIGGSAQVKNVMYPVISIMNVGGLEEEQYAGGDSVSPTREGKKLNTAIQIMPEAPEGQIIGAKSNEELLRSLGSEVFTALTTKANKATMVSSYDITQVVLNGGGVFQPLEQDNANTYGIPYTYLVEFLYTY